MSALLNPSSAPTHVPRGAASVAPVLIAEDNHDLADMLVHLIKTMGYDAIAVYDGQEAVWWCNAFKPRLVILDVNMPRLDGCAAAAQIRNSNYCPACIAAHTALELDHEPLKSGRGLFEQVLSKPVDFEQLERLLCGTLGAPPTPTTAVLS